MNQVITLAQNLAFDHPAAQLRQGSFHSNQGRHFAIALSPGIGQAGRIEIQVLEENRNDPVLACLRDSVGCLQDATNTVLDDKALVQMLISAKANSSVAGIGKAFDMGIFDVMHPAYAAQRLAIDRVLAAQ